MARFYSRKHKPLPDSFKDAISGFMIAFMQERNMHIQMCAAVIVIIVSLLIHVSLLELMIIFLIIGGVISLELVNTAIERVVDLATREQHPIAKAAKDTAAAAVWWFSVIAVIVYVMIVLHTLMKIG